MSDKEAVIEKIRKLLALAEGNANEHEREVAMRFAMDLLGKHNLSIAQMEKESLTHSVCAMRRPVPAGKMDTAYSRRGM